MCVGYAAGIWNFGGETTQHHKQHRLPSNMHQYTYGLTSTSLQHRLLIAILEASLPYTVSQVCSSVVYALQDRATL